jgi:hypothetical protein
MNLTTDISLDPYITLWQSALNKLEASYNTEFLGPTNIRFKDIGEPILPPVSKEAIPSTPQDTPLPPYASIAKPVSIKGTGGMDPIAQQIVAGLSPQLREIKEAISGSKGWEALGESIANVLNRAVSPTTSTAPTNGPLPALVAPDPRVNVLEGKVSSLESSVNSLVTQQGQILEQMNIDRQVNNKRHNDLLTLIQAHPRAPRPGAVGPYGGDRSKCRP